MAKFLESHETIRVVPAEPRTNMAQIHMCGDRSALVKAAIAVSARTKVWIFGDLTESSFPNWHRFDFVAGEGSLDVSPEETATLLKEVVSIAALQERAQ